MVLLFAGGEALVRGSVAVALHLGISRLIAGLLIVGFGTSAPELLVSVRAAMAGAPDIAVGNVVGSNIANVLLILGLAAVVTPIAKGDPSIRRDAVIMLGVSVGLVILLQQAEIVRPAGIAMLVAFAIYLTVVYVFERKRQASVLADEAKEVEDLPLSPLLAAAATLAGIGLLVFGARLLVDGATAIALDLGVSEAAIGLTIVAVGTSLPEMATALVAARRGHSDVVLGNVIGSNIFNILAILGTTAVITPVPVAHRFASVDGPVMLGVALLATVLLFASGGIRRTHGLALLAAYAAYVAIRIPLGAA